MIQLPIFGTLNVPNFGTITLEQVPHTWNRTSPYPRPTSPMILPWVVGRGCGPVPPSSPLKKAPPVVEPDTGDCLEDWWRLKAKGLPEEEADS